LKKILKGFFVSFFLMNVSQSNTTLSPQKSSSHTAHPPSLAGDARQAKSDPISIISSLDDALKAAYYYNVELEATRTALKQAVEGVALANSEWNPSFSVNADQRAQTSRDRSKQSFDFTEYENARIGSNSRGNSASLSLQAKQNLFSGGGTVARQEKSDAEFKASVARLTSQEQDTFIKVIEAYTQSALAQEVLDLEKKNETYFKGLLDQAKVRYEVGDQRLADVATAKAELASAVIKVCQAQAALDENRAKLQALINIPIASRLKMPSYYTENPKNLDQVKSISLKNNPLLVEGCYRERAARYNT
jgi:outer membrane protein